VTKLVDPLVVWSTFGPGSLEDRRDFFRTTTHLRSDPTRLVIFQRSPVLGASLASTILVRTSLTSTALRPCRTVVEEGIVEDLRQGISIN